MSDYLFSGLKVLDLATVIAGPVAATILADFGAEVIKIEQPGEGDMLRMLSTVLTTPDADSNYFWQMDGRNKRSLVLDLKSAEGMEVLHKLVTECDVFIINHPFPIRRSLKLEYEDLKPLNPGMIYASLSAFGEDGPDKDTRAFDQIAYWGRSGLMDLVRSPGAAPAQALPGMGDHPTSVALYASIVTALLNRERTGEGSMVHTSLLANGLWSAASIAQGALAEGDMPGYREANSVKGTLGRVYQTRDKRWLQATMVRTEEELLMWFAAMDAIHLFEDDRFSTPEAMLENRSALSELVQDILVTKDADEWVSIFNEMAVPVRKVADVEEAVQDEQVLINKMVVPPVDDDVDIPLIVNHPIKISNVAQVGPKRAPELGEHSEEILDSLGYSDAEIQVFKDKGVI
jgi:crotonobetainyl-CoA:carnitine CoA-transferase CaiB-like acyl-CoA transferase